MRFGCSGKKYGSWDDGRVEFIVNAAFSELWAYISTDRDFTLMVPREVGFRRSHSAARKLLSTAKSFSNEAVSTWSPGINKAMGVIATPSYVLYAVLTLILAINRLLLVLSPVLDAWLFSRRGLKSVGPETRDVHRSGGILASGLLYALIFGLLVHKRKMVKKEKVLVKSGGGSSSCFSLTDVQILVQAFCITAYCTVLNVLWHNYESLKLPNSRLALMLLNLMWIANSAVNPLVYFTANAAMRQRVSMAAAVNSTKEDWPLHNLPPI
uniref:Vomeronasal type-1 receptor n=1 Tax=Ditylenchus dipsaci TaxID=166011 RepID=A0A915E0E6_9BILA